jgi:hypothetical protein
MTYQPGSLLVRRATRRLTVAATILAGVFGGGRAQAQVGVVGSSIEEHEAAPGDRYEGTILLRNFSAQAQPVRIYQTDYRFSADGTSHFDTAGTTARSNARWLVPSTTSIVLPAGSDVTLSYVVTVPAVDSLRGTYWSALMIEGAPSAPPAAANRQVALGSVVRYAVQIATHLKAPGARRVRLTRQGFAPDSVGKPALDMVVENAGERAYRPLLWVELYDAAGTLRARTEQQRGLLYPGCSLRQRFTFAKLPAGEYKAVIFADTGDETVLATQYKLTF